VQRGMRAHPHVAFVPVDSGDDLRARSRGSCAPSAGA
jgi:hypothetical protein